PCVHRALSCSPSRRSYDLGPVRVEVHATLNEDRQLEVWISNPFKSTIDSQHKGTGFGLRGVRRRLFLRFGRTDLLDTRTESAVRSEEHTSELQSRENLVCR